MVNISDADTYSGVDGKGPEGTPGTADSGTFAEAASFAVRVGYPLASAADTVVHTEAGTPVIGVSQTDTGLATDGGESVIQAGPYEPVPDSFTGADTLTGIGVSDTDSSTGADGGEFVAAYITVRISSADVSMLPPSTPADSDGGGAQSFTAEVSAITAQVPDTDTGSFNDGR